MQSQYIQNIQNIQNTQDKYRKIMYCIFLVTVIGFIIMMIGLDNLPERYPDEQTDENNNMSVDDIQNNLVRYQKTTYYFKLMIGGTSISGLGICLILLYAKFENSLYDKYMEKPKEAQPVVENTNEAQPVVENTKEAQPVVEKPNEPQPVVENSKDAPMSDEDYIVPIVDSNFTRFQPSIYHAKVHPYISPYIVTSNISKPKSILKVKEIWRQSSNKMASLEQ